MGRINSHKIPPQLRPPAPQFTLPVAINYDAMDSQLLRRFWGHRGGEGREDAPPELGDRILVFHRGVGVVGGAIVVVCA